MRAISAERSVGVVCEYPGKAAFAAATARAASLVEPNEITPTASSVAGLMTW
jgi:hypothetical protein